MKKECYTVWVGGSEVNDYYLDRGGALRIAQIYIDDGYDDVKIEEVKEKVIFFILPNPRRKKMINTLKKAIEDIAELRDSDNHQCPEELREVYGADVEGDCSCGGYDVIIDSLQDVIDEIND